jgi:RNA polymerase sigma-70 factor (ECF subfamily)
MTFTTRSSLLDRVRTGGQDAWAEFARCYSPLLSRFAQRLGLRGQDVDEVVQNVLIDFFQARASFVYDREKGRFRDYLKRVVVTRLGKLLHQAQRAGTPQEHLPDGPGENKLEQRWEHEYRQHILREALALVRTQVEPKTYQAFDLYALQGVDPREVAHFLHVSLAVVYTSKNRVLERLRPLVQQLMEE